MTHDPADVAAVIRAIFGVTDYESASDGAAQQANRVLDALVARGWRAPGPRFTDAERTMLTDVLDTIERHRPVFPPYIDQLRAMLDGGGAGPAPLTADEVKAILNRNLPSRADQEWGPSDYFWEFLAALPERFGVRMQEGRP